MSFICCFVVKRYISILWLLFFSKEICLIALERSSIIVNVLVFFMQIFRLTILRFSSRTFFDLSSDFLCVPYSFLSDLYCSHFEVKLVANIGCSIATIRGRWPSVQCLCLGIGRSTVRIPAWSNVFPPACRSSAILPILVCLYLFVLAVFQS